MVKKAIRNENGVIFFKKKKKKKETSLYLRNPL